MQDILYPLIKFCNSFSRIICYGAGDYGHNVKCFLESNNIKIDAFLVSKKKDNNDFFMGIPLYSLDDVSFNIKDYGIILAMNENNHREIKKNIVKFFNKKDEIYAVNSNEIDEIRPYVKEKILLDYIQYYGEGKKNLVSLYEEKITIIKSKYKKIHLQYMDMRQVGSVNSWMYYLNKRERSQNGIYYLFYPKVYTHLLPGMWNGVNEYLSSKLTAEGIEMISQENINFWRYCLEKYRGMFFINANFCIHTYIKNFNIHVKKHKFKMDKKYIEFTNKEVLFGEKKLKEMQIQNEYVCISSRNTVYRKNVIKAVDHTEEIFDQYRNSDIQLYLDATTYLAENSIQSVRMGALVEEELEGKGVIDYAFKYRSEFMDLYLISKCKFFLSDPSGIQFLAQLFSKPLAIINSNVLTTQNDICLILDSQRDVAILKKYWDTKRSRYLTIKEMLNVEVNGFDKHYNICGPQNTFLIYHEEGIKPVGNTSEEIMELVKEMLERMNGTRVYDEEDEILQTKYRKIVDEFPKKNNFLFNWRLGSEFLKKNKWLLD